MNALYRSIPQLDWITGLLFLSLLLLTLGKYFYKGMFFTFIALPFNNKYLNLNRKKGKIVNGFHVLLSLLTIINIALLLYLCKNFFLGTATFDYPNTYGVLLLIVFGYLMLKLFLLMANGFFFENYDLMTDTIFEKFSYLNYSGFVAFVGNIIFIYMLQGSKTLLLLVLIGVFLVNIIGWVNTLRSKQNLILSNVLYFILYLCTLEIAPLAIFIGYLKG
ncbi:DUF4271 domain-containing protein [Flavobacterium sp. ASW18X]|uniref:DUF4271 domain-containing protein n=1 Tax=Flavobacterium sp. ASW18X TaxID=2572595 RepID=UPI0010ADBDAD|nr:DUF4271 domain-containing protein [Flavobacterium sp. ASW18X]TKD65404.1 DUF4271 domain-containing protein [Flavobacterium sp. ASW18X]